MYKLLANGVLPHDIQIELEKSFELIVPPGPADFSDSEMLELVRDADAILCIWVRKIKNEWLDAAERLKVIGNVAVGYDNIDVAYAAEKGISVVNTPMAVLEATAELAIGLTLSIMRGITRYDTNLRKSLRCNIPFFFDMDTLAYGKTMGVVGFGRVGRALARKAHGLGMNVVYYDPFRNHEAEEQKEAEYMPFDDVLKTSDVISIHMPYMQETRHLMNDRTFALMKPSAYFINTARGPIVEEAALIRALRNKVIKGAALDVYEFEPQISAELAELDNVVIVPHVGTMLMEVRRDMVNESVSGINDVLNGRTPVNLVRVKS